MEVIAAMTLGKDVSALFPDVVSVGGALAMIDERFFGWRLQ